MEKRIIGWCNIVVKDKVATVDTNLPKDMLKSLVKTLVEGYDLDTDKELELLSKTVVRNARFSFRLDEDSVITFVPELATKTSLKRFISVATSIIKEDRKS